LQGIPQTYRELERSLTLLSVLRGIGWQRSIRMRGPVDAHGREIPWFSYPAIDWLESRIKPTHKVLEFGAGHSTLWFARKAAHVTSVEHDARWADKLRGRVPRNVTLIPRNEANYVVAAGKGTFDVIVIDGIRRTECAQWAAKHVTRSGLIIFDNSDRPEDTAGIELLMKRGMYRIDFVGLLPQYGRMNCTSVFFRDEGYLRGEPHVSLNQDLQDEKDE
ncbi:MAG: class I SAM-dependent methyltransferase, partial [Ignavibacteriales bacterium]|nr:class I SAM-dependent methyltransferase [Ignavibacteriales bacterium]